MVVQRNSPFFSARTLAHCACFFHPYTKVTKIIGETLLYKSSTNNAILLQSVQCLIPVPMVKGYVLRL